MNKVVLLETLLNTPTSSYKYIELYTEVLRRMTFEEEEVKSMETEGVIKMMSMRKVQEMSNAYKRYIELLGKEIDELSKFGNIHGWTSSRIEEGKKLREEIEYFEKLTTR